MEDRSKDIDRYVERIKYESLQNGMCINDVELAIKKIKEIISEKYNLENQKLSCNEQSL